MSPTPVINTQLDTLNSKLDTLNGKLDTLNGKLDTQNDSLSIIAAASVGVHSSDWTGLERIADMGIFGDAYDYGTLFSDTWKDGSNEYTYPFQLNHIGSVTLEGDSTLSNRPFLQAHYAHPFGVQFSHQRAFLKCPSGLAAGTYYVTIESSWGSNVSAGDIVCFTLANAVPSGGRVAGMYGAPDQAKSNWRIYSFSADGKTILETVTPTFTASGTSLGTIKAQTRNGNLNSMRETAYGWNRWKTSAIRQYLNSDAAAGAWWTAQDEWDIRPDELATKAGFLAGCGAEFVSCIKKVKVVTHPNTVQDDPSDNSPDITYDRVFLPSLEQIYCQPQKSGEGEYHEYWKRRANATSPLAGEATYPNMITYAVENHSSAQLVRLRSAGRGNANNAWFVNGSGYVGSNAASTSFRFSPLVVL